MQGISFTLVFIIDICMMLSVHLASLLGPSILYLHSLFFVTDTPAGLSVAAQPLSCLSEISLLLYMQFYYSVSITGLSLA